MSYYDVEPKNRECRIGQKIYMGALAGRRGFRDDQLAIEEPEIWEEIFEHIGKVALEAVKQE